MKERYVDWAVAHPTGFMAGCLVAFVVVMLIGWVLIARAERGR